MWSFQWFLLHCYSVATVLWVVARVLLCGVFSGFYCIVIQFVVLFPLIAQIVLKCTHTHTHTKTHTRCLSLSHTHTHTHTHMHLWFMGTHKHVQSQSLVTLYECAVFLVCVWSHVSGSFYNCRCFLVQECFSVSKQSPVAPTELTANVLLSNHRWPAAVTPQYSHDISC